MASSFIDIKMRGAGRVRRQFRALGIKTQKKIIRPALRAGANTVKKDAKRRAPKRLGRLRRTIVTRSIKRSRVEMGFRVRTGTRAKLKIPASRKGYYPAAIEYGFTVGDVEVPPNMFLRNAANKNRRRVLRQIKKDIKDGVIRLAKATP